MGRVEIYSTHGDGLVYFKEGAGLREGENEDMH